MSCTHSYDASAQRSRSALVCQLGRKSERPAELNIPPSSSTLALQKNHTTLPLPKPTYPPTTLLHAAFGSDANKAVLDLPVVPLRVVELVLAACPDAASRI